MTEYAVFDRREQPTDVDSDGMIREEKRSISFVGYIEASDPESAIRKAVKEYDLEMLRFWVMPTSYINQFMVERSPSGDIVQPESEDLEGELGTFDGRMI